MSSSFEHQEAGIPLGRAGTARKAGSSRVVPSPSSFDSIVRKMSPLGARRRQSSFAKATADRGCGGQGASPHRLSAWQGAKTGRIGGCSNPENRPQSASIGPNRSESELAILFSSSGPAETGAKHRANGKRPRKNLQNQPEATFPSISQCKSVKVNISEYNP
jgi:hypothetical protein